MKFATRIRTGITFGAALLTSLALSTVAEAQNVQTKATDHDSAELIETVPIGKSGFEQGRSVMSLGIGSLGALKAGDKVRVGGEVQISVCLKPNSNHSGPGHDCKGKVYDYNPHLKAKLVLAPRTLANGGGSTTTISDVAKVDCHQRQPGRNHHCVIGIPVSNYIVDDPDQLPCDPSDCKVNMIVSAHHNYANPNGKHKVVVGSLKSDGRIDQGQGKISAARIPSGSDEPPVHKTTQRGTKGIPVVAKSNSTMNERVIMSLRVPALKAGEQLVIEARVRSLIGHLSYNVLNSTRMVLAENPDQTEHNGSLARKVAGSTTKLAASNGYNCTQAKSGFSKTCKSIKTGVLDVRNSTKKALFVNVVAGQRAQLFYHRWRSGDKAFVPKKHSFIKAWRYNAK